MRTKNTPLKDYVLLRDKRRNIVKKKGVVLTRVHYYMRVRYYLGFLFCFTSYTESQKLAFFSSVP